MATGVWLRAKGGVYHVRDGYEQEDPIREVAGRPVFFEKLAKGSYAQNPDIEEIDQPAPSGADLKKLREAEQKKADEAEAAAGHDKSVGRAAPSRNAAVVDTSLKSTSPTGETGEPIVDNELRSAEGGAEATGTPAPEGGTEAGEKAGAKRGFFGGNKKT